MIVCDICGVTDEIAERCGWLPAVRIADIRCCRSCVTLIGENALRLEIIDDVPRFRRWAKNTPYDLVPQVTA